MLLPQTWSRLPLELLQLILINLSSASKKDCYALCTLSRWVSRICIPILYRTFTLRCNGSLTIWPPDRLFQHISAIIVLSPISETPIPSALHFVYLMKQFFKSPNFYHISLSDFVLSNLRGKEAEMEQYRFQPYSLQITPHLPTSPLWRRVDLCKSLFRIMRINVFHASVTRLHFLDSAFLEPETALGSFPTVTHIAWTATQLVGSDQSMDLIPALDKQSFPDQVELAIIHIIITDERVSLLAERDAWFEAITNLGWPEGRIALIVEYDSTPRQPEGHHTNHYLDIWTRAENYMLPRLRSWV